MYPPKDLPHIIGGVLAFDSDWNAALGSPLVEALSSGDADARLDLGCVAAHGVFGCDSGGCYTIKREGKPAASFLLELIPMLQSSGTVPMAESTSLL